MKTIIKLFICLSLIYTPFFAFAGAAEKWEVLQNNYDHSSNKVKIEARKITQDAANSGRYKVEVPVSPAALGKTVKTMMWTGLAVAGVQAMLEGIGWIIDTGSKTIKRELPAVQDPSSDSAYLYHCGVSAIYSSATAACTARLPAYSDSNVTATIQSCSLIGMTSGLPYGKCVMKRYDKRYDSNQFIDLVWGSQLNPNAPPPKPVEFEYLDDAGLGNEIIGQGENSQPLPDAVQDAYSPNNPANTEPAPQATQDVLDNANPEPETEPTGDSKPKPNVDTDGDGEPDAYDPAQPDQGTEFQLPNFCSWAPAVCDFFTVQKADNKDIKKNQREQIEQDKTFFDSVKDWFDWSKEDSDLPENEQPEIIDLPVPELKEDAIKWNSQCPADVQIPINLQGVSSTITFSWSPWCQLLDVIKPAIIASAYIGAAFIVLGLRT